MQKTDGHGRLILSGDIVSKVHASIRAVAGGVPQVHIVSYTELLDEVLTRTGVGTMIERHQSHHVDYAQMRDLDAMERLQLESQRYTTPLGTPYVKPRDRSQLQQLLPRTLLLKHRDVIVGKVHATDIVGQEGKLLIGGFVIAENHQDSQHGELLLTEALSRFREKGCRAAVAITASERAARLFLQNGAVPWIGGSWPAELLAQARQRYHGEEREQVRLFHWSGGGSSSTAPAASTSM
jgi:N-acetylglutamate synthase-like GNAT family acetyltransferase